jgi:hypothetical protein
LRQEQLLVVSEGLSALTPAKYEPLPAMNKSNLGKLSLALALLAGAAVCFVKLSPRGDAENDKGFFYDLAEQRLFVAPRTLIPPIPGLTGGALKGVRAVVISTNANPGDKASRKIAYLEKYSPELKEVLEAVRAGKTSAVPSHQERQAQIFVRRLNEAEWYAVKSPEGEKILTEWNVPGPDGKLPSVCSP